MLIRTVEVAAMRVEVLYFDGCPSYERLIPEVRDVLAEAGVDPEIELRTVESPQAAERHRFLGSPTVRVDGVDVDRPAAGRTGFGLKCRLYRTDEGQRALPARAWVLAALEEARETAGKAAL